MEITNFILSLKKGLFGNKVVTITEPRMNKRGNPFIENGDKVQKITYYTNIGLGISYENATNNKLARNGEEANFEAEKPKGMTWEHYPFILRSDKNPDQKYLRMQYYSNTKVKSLYLVNGKLATPQQVETIKAFSPKSNSDSLIKVVSVKLENVVKIKQSNLTAKF